MALSYTSPIFQQVNSPAIDIRRMVSGLIASEGVVAAGDMAVAQRAAGANMSVDIAAGQAYVQGDAISTQGDYYVLNDAVVNVTGFTAAHATLPRIDRVCLRVRDAFHGDAANDLAFVIVTGTATSGATLANLTGAAAVPSSHLLLANILIPAAATTVTTANIANVAATLSLRGGVTSYRKTTSKTVNTTTAATDLLNAEITVAAGAMSTTGWARVSAFGDMLQNSGGAAAPPRLQLVLGGTTLLDTGVSGTLAASASRMGWRFTADILNLGAANAQASNMLFFLTLGTNVATVTANTFTTGEGVYQGVLNASSGAAQMLQAAGMNPSTALDTSTSKTLVLNVINGSASASYETKLYGALVEIV